MKRDRQAQEKLQSEPLKGNNQTDRSPSPSNRQQRQTIYDQIPIAIVESSLQGRYIDANEEFCQMVGYPKEQLLTLDMKDIIFEKDYPVVIKLYQQLAEGKIPSYRLEKRYVRQDGKIVWVETKRSLVRDAQGQGLHTMGTVRDVTERRTSFARQHKAFYQFAEQLHRTHSLDDVFQAALEATSRALRCKRASILLFDKTGVAQFVAWRGLSAQVRKALEGQAWWKKSDEKNPERTWMGIDDIETSDLSDSLKAIFKKERIYALAILPLVSHQELIGRLMVYFKKPHIFSVDEIEFGIAIARQLTFWMEHKQGQESLRENEEGYRRIVETANEGIWEIDKDMGTVFVNPRMAEMLGYTVEEMLGHSVFEFLFPEDVLEGEHRFERAKRGDPSRSNEFRYRRKDGSVLWTLASNTPKLDAQGNFLGAFAMFSDITELKQAEESLRTLNLELEQRVQRRTAELRTANQILQEEIAERKQAEELLRSWAHIFEKADWGIATVFKDTFVMMNPTFAKMHGYTVEELIGHSIYDVLAPESHAETRRQIAIAYATGHHVYENQHIRKDGSVFPALVDTSVIRDPAGNVLYRAINVQDITERKQAGKALEESYQYLQVLSRRLVEVQEEERRTIARDLHDRVGQNLSALKLNLSMVKDQLPEDPMRQFTARLDDSLHLVQETTDLVRNLLMDLRPAVLDDFGLKAALQAYIEKFTLRYNIQVVLDVASEPFPRLNPSLEITLLRIAQEALTNIARHAQADQATLSLRLENQCVYLTVLDNGLGLDVSPAKTHPVSHGIKIMRERAEAFGGTVKIGVSEPRGTKVEVIIPLGSTA
jgi:PAS domain S-box-containing protein